MNPTTAMQAARVAVARACKVCRGVQRELDTVRAIMKDDRSPVTVADFASQAVVVWTLTEALGEQVIVGEEDANTLRSQIAAGDRRAMDAVAHAVRTVVPGIREDAVLDAIDGGDDDVPSTGGFWTLDPIDGTKGFLRGQQYAVSLAYIEHGRPTIGLLGCPNLSPRHDVPTDEADPVGTIYLAEAGQGLYQLHADDELTGIHEEPLKLQRPIPADDAAVVLCESVEAAHTSHADADRILDELGAGGRSATTSIRLDGQGKYAVVARGQAELYLRLPRVPKPGNPPYREKIWDHAAGTIVALEAGCAVTDARGQSLDYGQGVSLAQNSGVIVAPPVLHGRVLAAIESLGLTFP